MSWIFWLLAVGSMCQIRVDAQTQRVAPGVPPQQYQQPPPMHGGQQMHQQVPQQQMHHQQVPQQQQMHHQQVPQQQQMHHQQVPQQQQMHHQQQQFQHVPVQQQQQQHHQQVPMNHQQQGHHHDHDAAQQLLKPGNMAHEKEHIAEHLDVPMDTSKMTEQELQFHYFKMHDADNNNKLDGSELIKSLIHWHDQGNQANHANNAEGGAPNAGDKLFTNPELESLIDPILEMDDTDKDGYIDYPEFIRAQQKAAASGTT